MEDEVVHEFLVESEENLVRLDQEIVLLEQRPGDSGLLASIFRIFHTIKGASGFLGFPVLEKLTHEAENLLSNLRSGLIRANPTVISLLLESVDGIRNILREISETGQEAESDNTGLILRLGEAVGWASPTSGPAHALGASDGETADTVGVSESTIRVDVGLLDKLSALVGELAMFRHDRHDHATLNAANAASRQLNLIIEELQDSVTKMRMQPIGVAWNHLPRLVRDLSKALAKQVELKMEGAGTQLDRAMIEAIKDPLTHLIRNCCDHGIEAPELRTRKGKPITGKITLRAFLEGGHVIIEIGDDGQGIDGEALKRKALAEGILPQHAADRFSDRDAIDLIFKPGFSMVERVTRISGRGVGMDVVKTNIERIGGVIDVASKVDSGVTIRLKIPINYDVGSSRATKDHEAALLLPVSLS